MLGAHWLAYFFYFIFLFFLVFSHILTFFNYQAGTVQGACIFPRRTYCQPVLFSESHRLATCYVQQVQVHNQSEETGRNKTNNLNKTKLIVDLNKKFFLFQAI